MADHEHDLFEAAQEAVKTLSALDDSNKLRLYAHYKQATVGPAQGSRPSIFNQVARAKWDAWSQLGSMSAADAKLAYCRLADEFVPGWREAMQPATNQNEAASARAEVASSHEDDENSLFEAAQEAVKTLSALDDSNKLRLYAHYKQATVGPAQGSRPSIFNQVARAKWDAWSQLGSMSAADAKLAYCRLADEFVPGWREAMQPATNQNEAATARAEVASSHEDDENSLFEAAQEAVKTLSALDDSNKLRLYAHYKQATVGPAQGSRPSIFNQVARAKWDAWSQLGSMSAADAKLAYCRLADEFVPGWREAMQPATNQNEAATARAEVASSHEDDENSLFEAAQDAVKTLSALDDSNKLRLYAHYKQATVGPAQGSRPSIFNQVARAKWDAWSQLGSMSAADAKLAYCRLADEFVPGWREAMRPATNQNEAASARAEVASSHEDDENSLFEAAQEAVKTLSALDDSNKLRLYAHYKQATVGPAQGSRPSIFNQVARAKWDAWSQLGSMSAADAKLAYCRLADEFVPGWREAMQPATNQNEAATARAEVASSHEDDENSLFEAAQEAVKTLSALGDSNKLRLYAHYKQATVGPAQGSRPSIFNQVARAKWDAWSQLGSMSAADAKLAYCRLADEFVPGWRPSPCTARIGVQQAPESGSAAVPEQGHQAPEMPRLGGAK